MTKILLVGQPFFAVWCLHGSKQVHFIQIKILITSNICLDDWGLDSMTLTFSNFSFLSNFKLLAIKVCLDKLFCYYYYSFDPQGEFILYTGDPLQDFTLIRFLDRFVFRNPKQTKGKRKQTLQSDTLDSWTGDFIHLLNVSFTF